MLKSEFLAQKRSAKPQWKCPDCRTINKMDYNCSKCRKDCFSFNPPPSLANPDEKESEEEVKAAKVPQPSKPEVKQAKDSSTPINSFQGQIE